MRSLSVTSTASGRSTRARPHDYFDHTRSGRRHRPSLGIEHRTGSSVRVGASGLPTGRGAPPAIRRGTGGRTGNRRARHRSNTSIAVGAGPPPAGEPPPPAGEPPPPGGTHSQASMAPTPNQIPRMSRALCRPVCLYARGGSRGRCAGVPGAHGFCAHDFYARGFYTRAPCPCACHGRRARSLHRQRAAPQA
jgi:hypothetical protein